MSNIAIEERRGFVGASEVASLFSLDLKERGHRVYETRYELWARKSGLIESTFKGNERSDAGIHLEAGIASLCAKRFGWNIQNARRYIHHHDVDRMGASPDYEIVAHPFGPAWLEIKNVDRSIYNSWPRVEGADDREFVEATGLEYQHKRREPPLRLQLQVQHQLACSSRSWAVLAILVGGNELVAIPYPRVDITIRRIEEEVPLFWAEVDTGMPPPIDWSADARTVSRLYGYSDPLKVRNFRSDQALLAKAREHHRLGMEIRSREDRREVLKAQMLERIGDAAKVLLGDGFSISAGMVDGREVNYYRDPYRQFRVSQRRRR